MAYENGQIEPMLTTSEVARILNVHINTVRRWSNQGTLKSYRIGSRGDRRFRKEDIDLLFNTNGGLNKT
jgi:excisionase family DNA binding protein